MDFVKNLAGGGSSNNSNDSKIGQASIPTGNMPTEQSGGSGAGGFLGGLGERFNSAAGGGAEGEKREDYLDKGMLMKSRCFQVACSTPLPSLYAPKHNSMTLLLL